MLISCRDLPEAISQAGRKEDPILVAEGALQAAIEHRINEGLDIPAINTVLLLRPTESAVVFLQQLGRGLRRADGKTALTVLDFVGNHRVFLARLRTLLDMAPAGSTPVPLAPWLQDTARRAQTVLPPGH